MKVKNVVFSGFMAAILSATGANAAISVASKAYVDKFVGENGSVTTELSELTKTVTDNKTETDNALDLKANTADVEATYATKTFVGSLEGKNAATIVEYIEKKTADIASGTAFSELTGRVDTAEGKITALETLTGENGKIAQDIAKALTDAEGYADGKAADAQAAAELTAKGYVDALDEELATVAKTGAYSDLTGVPVVDAVFSATSSNAATSSAIATYVDGVKNDLSNGVAAEVESIQEDITELVAADQTLQGSINTLSGTVSDMDAAYKAADAGLDTAVKAAQADATQALADAAAASTAAGDALTGAKAYTDELANGAVKTNTEAISAINNAENGILAQANSYADTKASAEAKKEAKAVADTLKFLATAEVPEECLTGEDGSNMCVLTLTSAGTFAWTPLTTPVE